jgi:hypothetical protein
LLDGKCEILASMIASYVLVLLGRGEAWSMVRIEDPHSNRRHPLHFAGDLC